MNGETRDPQLPDDNDIPTLTEIVVPGRLRAQPPAADGAGQAPPEFVFDIAFAPTDARGEQPYAFRARALAAEPEIEPNFDFRGQASSPVQDADLPLPWAAQGPPEPVVETQAAAPAMQPDETQPPPIVVPGAAPAVTVAPPDADAQALLRALLAEIGSGLEQRLHEELALTEQRLRAALREELDTRLRELLAGTPPTA
jgi:hypothetical protein